MNNDLVVQAALYLEVSTIAIFGLAAIYAGKNLTRKEAKDQWFLWRRSGKYNQDVENLCLDLLSRRTPVSELFTFVKHQRKKLEDTNGKKTV